MYPWVIPDELDSLGDENPFVYEACQTASFILYALSGRKYTGSQTVTETYECPCRFVNPRDLYPASDFSALPVLVNGGVQNVLTGTCGCNPLAHSRLRLRGRPVRGVHRVSRGDEVLDPGDYQVVNYSTLQAAPGGSFDPCGITVTYSYGAEPPTAGRRAARNLAEELAKSWFGDDTCRLPDRITSIARQNVTYTVLDQQDFLEELRTGIYSVDLFLRAVNPDKARKPARVLSPDMPRAIRSTMVAIDPREHDLVIESGVSFSWDLTLSDIDAEYVFTEGWEPQAQLVSTGGVVLETFVTNKFTVSDNLLTFDLTDSETAAITQGGIFELYAVNPDGPTVVSLLTSTVFIK